jgi:hypothetical protein
MSKKLYHYSCWEASKYFREGYTWNYTLKMVKDEVRRNFLSPARIKIRLIGAETNEYCEQLKIKKEQEKDM